MVRPTAPTATPPDVDSADRDERLGIAIEEYLALAEAGVPPDPESFAAAYPDMVEDVKAALEGLAMVHGLVGHRSGPGGAALLEAGRRVAGYRIVRELGRGGMGVVYEAVHVDLDRPVALKVLNTHAAPDSSGRRRFLNEAKTAAGLHHTHIVPVFDVGQVGGLCYYAMQRIEGCGLDRVVKALRKGRTTAAGSGTGKRSPEVSILESLDATSLGDPTRSWFGASKAKPGLTPERIDEPPPFEPPRGSEYYRWVARAGAQAAEALAHAHRRGVVHRDVKPSNLLVDARGTVWVADFGLARRLADPGLTQGDSLLGTPRYMSPEQSEIGPLDGRTDVYSLGATLYELLTLRPPYEGRSAAELIGQIKNKEPIAPRKHDAKLPRDLETIVLKAMAKRASDRYADAAELAEDLHRFLATEPVKARRIGPIGRGWRFARRHPGLTAVSTVAAAAILTTATVAHVRVLEERNQAILAKTETQKALGKVQAAEREAKAAMREQYSREASLVRLSGLPDRRKRGLAALAKAVDLGPGPAMKATLRDEAAQFLALRDIEPRAPLETGNVRHLAFSPDLGRMATLSEDGSELGIWDVARRERLARQSLGAGREPDHDPRRPQGNRPPWLLGPRLAAVGGGVAAILPEGEGVRLFDVASGARFADLAMTGRKVENLFASPNGHRLVTVEEPGGRGGPRDRPGPDSYRISLWNPCQGDAPIAFLNDVEPRIDSLALPSRGGPRFPKVAFSPDNRTIATAWVWDTEITLWDASDGRKLGALTAEGPITALAFAPDGVLAAACSGVVHRWEPETRRPLPGLSLHQPFVWNLRFSPDGSMLAVTAGMVKGIELWDTEGNSLLASVPTNEWVHDLAFSPDGRTLAAAVEETTRLWAVVEPIGRTRLVPADPLPSTHLIVLAFGPLGDLAATYANERAISARFQFPGGGVATREGAKAAALGFDPAGRLIVSNGNALELYKSPRDIEPETSIPLPEMPPSDLFGGMGRDRNAPSVPESIQSADGRTLLMIRPGQFLLVRFGDGPPTITPLAVAASANYQAGRSRGDGRPPRGGSRGEDRNRGRSERLFYLWNLALSPDGTRLYGEREGEPFAVAIEGDRLRYLDNSGLPRDVSQIVPSPDGRHLALGLRNGEVVLADARTLRIVAAIPAPEEAETVTAVAFSSEGQLAVGFRSGLIRLWDMRGKMPEPLLTLPGYRNSVRMMAYSASGDRLAIGDNAGTDVWDVKQVRQRLAEIGLGW